MAEEKDEFLEFHIVGAQVNGIYEEQFSSTIYKVLESNYKPSIVRNWGIIAILPAPDKDKHLVKWKKRIFPLSDEQMKERYGPNIKL